MASSDAIQSLAQTIDALAVTNQNGFEFLGRNQLSTNKHLALTNNFMESMDRTMRGMEQAAYESARDTFKDIDMPEVAAPGDGGVGAGGAKGPQDKSKVGMLKGIGSLFSGAGIGGGVAMAGLGALFAGGGYLIKQLNELDGEKIAREIEALTNMKVGMVDTVKLTSTLIAIGIGLSALGFGKMVMTGANAAEAAVSGDAFQSFIGSEGPPTGFAEGVKKDVEGLLAIGKGITINDMFASGKFAITLGALGFGLAMFGAGKLVEGTATAVTGVMHEGVKRFTGKDQAGMGKRVKTEVEDLLSIEGGVLDGIKIAATLSALGVGLAFFGIGKVVDGVATTVEGASQGAVEMFTGTESTGFGKRVKTEVENLLSIGGITFGNVAGVVGALSGLGIGLALFGVGKAVAGAGGAIEGGGAALTSKLEDNPIYSEKGFGQRIKDEVETLLSIGDGKGNLEMLGESGTFVLMMSGIAAGLAVFGGGQAIAGIGNAIANFTQKGDGDSFASKIKSETDILLGIGKDADIAEANNLHAVLTRIGSALSTFAGEEFGASLKNLGSSILDFFSGGGDKDVTTKMLELAEKSTELSGAADAMEQLGVSLEKIGQIDLGSGDKLALEKMSEDLMDSMPWLEGAIYGGEHAEKLGLSIGGTTDSDYYKHGIGLANIDPLDMAQSAQNLNLMVKAAAGTLGSADLFNVDEKMLGDIEPATNQRLKSDAVNDAAGERAGGDNIVVDASNNSTNNSTISGGDGGGAAAASALQAISAGTAGEADDPFSGQVN